MALNWGILGAGMIVRRLMGGARTAGLQVSIIGSRSIESAEKAAAELGIPRFGSYDDVLQSEVDAVYVAVPHQAHYDLALAGLRAGKHVLVEKPACVNRSQWEALTHEAEKESLLLMEAFWTRCFPIWNDVRQIIASGEPGRFRHVQSYSSSYVPLEGEAARHSRLFDPAQAGGGLLDMGVYSLQLCDLLFDCAPERCTGFASLGETGVDEQAVIIERFPDGALAEASCGLRARLPSQATLTFDRGTVEIPRYIAPSQMIVRRSAPFGSPTPEPEVREIPTPQPAQGRNEGFAYELEEFERCAAAGLLESPRIPWASTGRVLALCDELRRSWGLRYPFE